MNISNILWLCLIITFLLINIKYNFILCDIYIFSLILIIMTFDIYIIIIFSFFFLLFTIDCYFFHTKTRNLGIFSGNWQKKKLLKLFLPYKNAVYLLVITHYF